MRNGIPEHLIALSGKRAPRQICAHCGRSYLEASVVRWRNAWYCRGALGRFADILRATGYTVVRPLGRTHPESQR